MPTVPVVPDHPGSSHKACSHLPWAACYQVLCRADSQRAQGPHHHGGIGCRGIRPATRRPPGSRRSGTRTDRTRMAAAHSSSAPTHARFDRRDARSQSQPDDPYQRKASASGRGGAGLARTQSRRPRSTDGAVRRDDRISKSDRPHGPKEDEPIGDEGGARTPRRTLGEIRRPGRQRDGRCRSDAQRPIADVDPARSVVEQLHEQLASSSSDFAQSALRALPVGDHTTFVLHASIALEHAMKALLARRHPALMAAADFDSLLHACGDGADARVPRHRMRTITGRESLNRVGQLLPSVHLLSPQLAPLFEARNAVAHLGEPALSDELRVPFLKCADHASTLRST